MLGRPAPAMKVQMANTGLLPYRSATLPHSIVVISPVVAAMALHIAMCVNVMCSSERKYGTTNGAPSMMRSSSTRRTAAACGSSGS